MIRKWVDKITIQEQKDYLKEQLVVETFTSSESNKCAVQGFVASKKGKGLERYLKENAWEEDIDGNTKVYLVKDKNTKEIVFFFALNAGLLYSELNERENNLTEQEKEIVDICVQYKLGEDNTYTPEEIFEWYKDSPLDKEKLRRIIEEETQIKFDAKNDVSKTDKGVNIKHVLQTYPSIVLTHFCKNVKIKQYDKLTIPLGFYVFWEIVIEKVLEIAQLLGCQYLYLFAADNSEKCESVYSVQNMIYDIDEDEIVPTYKLVEYYKNELKFEAVQRLTILKPHYDFECFSLFQPIKKLLDNRERSWIQHSDLDE